MPWKYSDNPERKWVVLWSADVVSSVAVVTVDMQAVEGKSVELPCNVTPPGHDKVYMVFWFRDDAGIPLYR